MGNETAREVDYPGRSVMIETGSPLYSTSAITRCSKPSCSLLLLAMPNAITRLGAVRGASLRAS